MSHSMWHLFLTECPSLVRDHVTALFSPQHMYATVLHVYQLPQCSGRGHSSASQSALNNSSFNTLRLGWKEDGKPSCILSAGLGPREPKQRRVLQHRALKGRWTNSSWGGPTISSRQMGPQAASITTLAGQRRLKVSWVPSNHHISPTITFCPPSFSILGQGTQAIIPETTDLCFWAQFCLLHCHFIKQPF
jgi:hypothetical protein